MFWCHPGQVPPVAVAVRVQRTMGATMDTWIERDRVDGVDGLGRPKMEPMLLGIWHSWMDLFGFFFFVGSTWIFGCRIRPSLAISSVGERKTGSLLGM